MMATGVKVGIIDASFDGFGKIIGGRFAACGQGGGPVLYQGNRILHHTLVHSGLEPESKDLKCAAIENVTGVFR